MSTNQDTFNFAYEGVIAELDGSALADVSVLESRIARMYRACNPLAYDPNDPPATFTPSQYAHLFNFGFTAITDDNGETFYFAENYELDLLKNRFAYLVADPESNSIHRSQDANQAVFAEALKLLVRSEGSASDELALYAIEVMEDALSMSNRRSAVLSDAYRVIIAGVHTAFKDDGADEVVLDRLEALLSRRSRTSLIVDAEGIARTDPKQLGRYMPF